MRHPTAVDAGPGAKRASREGVAEAERGGMQGRREAGRGVDAPGSGQSAGKELVFSSFFFTGSWEGSTSYFAKSIMLNY